MQITSSSRLNWLDVETASNADGELIECAVALRWGSTPLVFGGV